MKLHWSPKAPFVRKVLILADEVGLSARLNRVRTVVAPSKPNAQLQLDNPLSKVPTLVLDDGSPLYDSRVICEYLDSLHQGRPMIPRDAARRWVALRRQALADGILDVLIMWRDEDLRAEDKRNQPLLSAFRNKVEASLAQLEVEAALFGSDFDIGQIAVGCMLSYLDLRFAELAWRDQRPALTSWYETSFAQRPSVVATRPVDDLPPPAVRRD